MLAHMRVKTLPSCLAILNKLLGQTRHGRVDLKSRSTSILTPHRHSCNMERPASNGVGASTKTNNNNNNNSDITQMTYFRPKVTNEAILAGILKDNYGLIATSFKPLDGYDDANFHVQVEPEHCNPYLQEVSQLGYVFKIINALDSKQPELQRGIIEMARHVGNAGIPVQKTIRALSGADFFEITLDHRGEKQTFLACLRSFLPGIVLKEASCSATLSYDLGVFFAKLTKSMETFHHSFYEDFEPTWNMNKFHLVGDVTHAVKNDKYRAICEDVLHTFSKEVMPRRDHFKKGYIHADLNEGNILVEACDGNSSGYAISGIIDFQDSCQSYIVYEITVALAYIMMLPRLEIRTLDAAGHVLAGYTSLVQLNQAEEQSLKTLIAARMTMSLVYGAYTYSLEPTNHYLLNTAKVGWTVLEQFWGTPNEIVKKRWDEISQSYKEM